LLVNLESNFSGENTDSQKRYIASGEGSDELSSDTTTNDRCIWRRRTF
jgi:hypothetical protein